MKVTIEKHGDFPYEFFLDGQPVEAVVSADDEAGEITFLARHWQSGEFVLGPDGQPETLTAYGKVEIHRIGISQTNHPDGATCGLCGRSDLEWGKYCPDCTPCSLELAEARRRALEINNVDGEYQGSGAPHDHRQ